MEYEPSGREGPRPPSNLEAEREVLAACLVDSAAWDVLAEIVQAEDFYWERHAWIYRAMEALKRASKPIDPVLLQWSLRDLGVYEKVGGARAIGELLDRAGTVANVDHYCREVAKLSLVRRMIEAGQRINVAGHEAYDVDAYIQHAEELLRDASEGAKDVEPTWADAIIEAGEEGLGVGPAPLIVPTGIGPYDLWLGGGHEGGQTYVYMCGPGVGKTSVALGNFAVTCATQVSQDADGNVCDDPGGVIYVFAEMTPKRLGRRMLSQRSGVPVKAFKRRDMTAEQQSNLIEAMDAIINWPILPRKMRTVERILSMLWKYKKSGVPCGNGKTRAPLRMVVIDYWQRIKHNQKSAVDGSTEGMHRLQEGIGELGIVCIVLSQPSTTSRREGKAEKSTGADAKGSGAIEEDADGFAIIERGDEDRQAAGLRVVKARDNDDGPLPYWPAVDTTMKGKTGSRHVPASGWRWIRGRIVAPVEG